MNNYLSEPLIFLINVLLGLYITLVMLRFLFQLLRVDFYNPLAQAIVKLTNPPLRTLRRFIPRTGKIDASAIILMLALQYLTLILTFLIGGQSVLPLMLLLLSAVQLIELVFYVFIFAIIMLAIMSWLSPPYHANPVTPLLEQLTRPIIWPIRRLIQPISGIDFTPFIACIALFFFKLLLIPLLRDVALHVGI